MFQNLVYANKTARLLDTRLSDPGDIYVSRNVDYPSIQYNLTNPGDVEAFWNDALRFSLGTKLGKFLCCFLQYGEKVGIESVYEHVCK